MKKILGCVSMILMVLAVVMGAGWVYRAIPEKEKAAKANAASKEVKEWAGPDLDYLAYYGLEPFDTSLPVSYTHLDVYKRQVFGPLFDFLYLVAIYSLLVNKMVKIYDSGEGREDWKW